MRCIQYRTKMRFHVFTKLVVMFSMIYSFHSQHCDAEQAPRVPGLSNDEAWSRPLCYVGSTSPSPIICRQVMLGIKK